MVRSHGVEALGVMLIVAGAIQILAGVLRVGQWFRAVAPSVVTGMLAGIGILIVAAQLHVFIDDAPRASGLANLTGIPESFIKAVSPPAGTVHHHAAIVGLATLVSMILWKKLKPKKLKFLPEALIGVVVGAAVATGFDFAIKHVLVPDNLLDAVRIPSLESFKLLAQPAIWVGIATIAFVASAETLLSASAVDRMHSGPASKFDKELVAQGLGNSLAGVLGALPLTGVIVRSAANVEAGAKTRLSAMLHGVWLLVFVAALPFVLRLVPMASLAAILVYIGAKLVDWRAIVALRRYGRGEVAICLVTIVGIVAVDLLSGVIAGLVFAAVRLLYRMSKLEVRVENRGDHYQMWLRGAATFVGIPKLAAALETMPRGSEVHLNIAELAHTDHAALEILASWEKRHAATGGMVLVEWRDLEAMARRKPKPTDVEAADAAAAARDDAANEPIPAAK